MKPTQVIAVLLICASLAGVAQAEPLTLRRAEQLGLERNLHLQAGSLRLQAAAAAVEERKGLYDLQLRAFAAEGETRDAFNSTTLNTINESRYTRLDLSLLQKLPSGADLGLAMTNRREDALAATAVGIDPAWRSELRLSLVQPLLKGFGRMATEEPILLAVVGREAALADLQERAVTVVAQLRDLFAEIRRAREVVAFREASVTVAQTVLAENRARVDAGVLPPIDILEAEVGLKQRERELLDAEQNRQEQLDRLAEVLALVPPVEVETEPFVLEAFAPAEDADLAAALAGRPDLQRARLEEDRTRLEQETAEQRRLPALDLSAAYAQRGFDGSYGGDLDQTLTDELRNWEIGLELKYPLGNRQAENEALRKKFLAQAAGRDYARLAETVRREIRTAARQMTIGQMRLDVTQQGTALAEEKLKTLFKRREVGLATTRDVLEGEAELARARNDHAEAQAAWSQAATEYLRATGRLLAHEGIAIVPQDTSPPQLSLDPAAP